MLLWVLIFSSLSSSWSSFLVPLLFCCACLLLPACLLFALSRTDPAFLDFRVPRFAVQEDPKKIFPCAKTHTKTHFHYSLHRQNALKQTGAQKTSFFKSHFWLLKQLLFARARVQNPRENHFFHIYTRKSKIAFSKKGPITPPPPPPPPPSPTLSVGAAFSRSKRQKTLGSVTWP